MICTSNFYFYDTRKSHGLLSQTVLLYFHISALIDLSESSTDEKKQIDIYAIGFEEMVDLDAKNIVNAR